jgi:major type 1 subunit fimbrin (pilin)
MNRFTLIATAAALFSAQYANAADGTINFTGSITDTACTVNTSSTNQTVALGTVSSTSLAALALQPHPLVLPLS